jgi:hypothetical protein
MRPLHRYFCRIHLVNVQMPSTASQRAFLAHTLAQRPQRRSTTTAGWSSDDERQEYPRQINNFSGIGITSQYWPRSGKGVRLVRFSLRMLRHRRNIRNPVYTHSRSIATGDSEGDVFAHCE